MPTYTVHAPPPRAGETTSDPQRFVFVRDGFHFWAFLLAPLWLLAHRLWLALIGYVAASALLGGLFYLLGAPDGLRFLGSLLVALLIGFEAASLRRWTLARRGWRALGFVVGDDAENAERRFFAEWTGRPATPLAPPAAAEPNYAAPVRRGAPTGSDVIGLFPEPGNQR
jgi:predicted lipid-binding transport protein (Tim44 family)